MLVTVRVADVVCPRYQISAGVLEVAVNTGGVISKSATTDDAPAGETVQVLPLTLVQPVNFEKEESAAGVAVRVTVVDGA